VNFPEQCLTTEDRDTEKNFAEQGRRELPSRFS